MLDAFGLVRRELGVHEVHVQKSTHLGGICNGFALSFLDIGAEDFPEVGDRENTIGTLENRVEGIFVVEVGLGRCQQ